MAHATESRFRIGHRSLGLVAAVLAGAACAAASGAHAADGNPLASERWRTRPLVVVVPQAQHPLLQRLQAELGRDPVRAGFEEREMVLITVVAGQGQRRGLPLSPDETGALLDALQASSSGPATAYLVGKDGGVKLVRRDALTLDEVFATVDSMPMRRR